MSLYRFLFSLIVALILSGCADHLKIKSYAPRPESGDMIGGTVTKPEGDGPFPGVIILHGCSGVNDLDYSWARRLKSWGYASLILDSHSPRGILNNCKSNRRVSKLERALDVHAAKVQFGQLPYVDRSRIGVIGFSEGGGTILEAVRPSLLEANVPEEARDPLKAAVALYPFCYGGGESNTDLVILIGDKDDWTPATLCEANLPKATSSEIEIILKIYPGAYHSFDYQKKDRVYKGHTLRYSPSAMSDAVPRVKAFFDKNL